MNDNERYHNMALFLNRVSVTGPKEAEIYLDCLQYCLKKAQTEPVKTPAKKEAPKRARVKKAASNGARAAA